ncbi:hypothetical protein CYMTET_13620 [Cymbomonas tetramitiformis]|uniref:Uncharacterized protein n=1 Tax=Cymbomonas tetramitiformis TaxID=36881 RepID=A0AAE0GI39_9CHLO|nr:hypothetical protein CYMTET_13620 [Cymbomonas tetramitiformis]
MPGATSAYAILFAYVLSSTRLSKCASTVNDVNTTEYDGCNVCNMPPDGKLSWPASRRCKQLDFCDIAGRYKTHTAAVCPHAKPQLGHMPDTTASFLRSPQEEPDLEFQLVRTVSTSKSTLPSFEHYELIVLPYRYHQYPVAAACWRGMSLIQEQACAWDFPSSHKCDLQKFAACLYFKNIGNLGALVLELKWVPPTFDGCAIEGEHQQIKDAVLTNLTFAGPDLPYEAAAYPPLKFVFDTSWMTDKGDSLTQDLIAEKIATKCMNMVRGLRDAFSMRVLNAEGGYATGERFRTSESLLEALHFSGFSAAAPEGLAVFAAFLPVQAVQDLYTRYHERFSHHLKAPKHYKIPELDSAWLKFVELLTGTIAECHRATQLRLLRVENMAEDASFSKRQVHSNHAIQATVKDSRLVLLYQAPYLGVADWLDLHVTIFPPANSKARRWQRLQICGDKDAAFRSITMCQGHPELGRHIQTTASDTAITKEQLQHALENESSLQMAAETGLLLMAVAATVLAGMLFAHRHGIRAWMLGYLGMEQRESYWYGERRWSEWKADQEWFSLRTTPAPASRAPVPRIADPEDEGHTCWFLGCGLADRNAKIVGVTATPLA